MLEGKVDMDVFTGSCPAPEARVTTRSRPSPKRSQLTGSPLQNPTLCALLKMQLAKVLVLVAGAVASSEGADSSLRTSVNGALQGDQTSQGFSEPDKDWMVRQFKKLEERLIQEIQNKSG
jgi:hypothetical protein